MFQAAQKPLLGLLAGRDPILCAPLHPGTSQTLIQFLLKTFTYYTDHGLSERAMDSLLQLIRDALGHPLQSLIPATFQDAVALVQPFIVKHQRLLLCNQGHGST